MYCSTCGARVAEGRTQCQSCGAVVARMQAPAAIPAYTPVSPPASMIAGTILEPVGLCPRCGFRGQSVSYFSRGGHVAGLVVLAAITSWAFAFGGIIYWALMHNHRVCPRCGEGWGKHGTGALALPAGPSGVVMPRVPVGDDLALSGGGGKRTLAMLLFIFAAILTMVGISAPALPPLVMAMFAGGGGYLLRRSAHEDRERRREELIQQLQLPVLQLAGRRGGRLTVTDVVTEFGWSIPRAEKVLNSMEDGLRVMSDITDDGVIVYDFVEIRAAQLGGGSSSASAPRALAADGPQPSALSA